MIRHGSTGRRVRERSCRGLPSGCFDQTAAAPAWTMTVGAVPTSGPERARHRKKAPAMIAAVAGTQSPAHRIRLATWRDDQRLVERSRPTGSAPADGEARPPAHHRRRRAQSLGERLESLHLAPAGTADRRVPREARQRRARQAAVAHRLGLEQPRARHRRHGSSPSAHRAARGGRHAGASKPCRSGICNAAAISGQLISSTSAISRAMRLGSLIRRSARSMSPRAFSAGPGSTASSARPPARPARRRNGPGPGAAGGGAGPRSRSARAGSSRGRRSARRSWLRRGRWRAPDRRRPRRPKWRAR